MIELLAVLCGVSGLLLLAVGHHEQGAVDTGEAVARRTRHVLQMDTADPDQPLHAESTLMTTGDAGALTAAAHRWLGWHRPAQQVVVPD